MGPSNERQSAVRAALDEVKRIAARAPLSRERLAEILQHLLVLAAHTDWWQADDYPDPDADERHARYLISEQPDRTLALYLNVMRPGNRIAPHDHTTWATIAAVDGVEFNHLYRRTDDGSEPGVAQLEHFATIEVGPGRGVALLPDDIHAVEIRGEAPIRHLHLYGRALETLDQRVAYDLETGRYAPMAIGVATRRRPD